MNIFFDVDGTLISEDDVLRPHAKTVLEVLKEQGHKLYCWSAEGHEYAKRIACENHIEECFEDFFSKYDDVVIIGQKKEKKKTNVKPDIIIDDDWKFIKYEKDKNEKLICIKVKFYDPRFHSDDKDLFKVFKVVRNG